MLELCSGELGWQGMSLDGGTGRRRAALPGAYARAGWEEQVALLSHETVTLGQGTVGHAWQRRQPVFVPRPDGPGPAAGRGRTGCPAASWRCR